MRVEPIAERHREGLREAAEQGPRYSIVDDDWPAAKALLEKKIDRHAG